MTAPSEWSKLAASFAAIVRAKGIPRWTRTTTPATDLQTGVRYRTLWYQDDHYWSGHENIAYCGRLLTIPTALWNAITEGSDSSNVAPLYISERTSGLCRECARGEQSPPLWASQRR